MGALIDIGPIVARWLATKAIEDAADVIDAAIISGNYESAFEAAKHILSPASNAVHPLQSAARQILGESSDRPLGPNTEGRTDLTTQAIRGLKTRLKDSPRDAITAVEVARLYTLLGQTRSAKKYIEWAIAAAPEDRYILRCAARFFIHISQSDRALHLLWGSMLIKTDPWVQSAEVAVAELCGKTPRWGLRRQGELLDHGINDVSNSELAAGLATFQMYNGAKRKIVRQLATVALRRTTENALAQVQWLNGRDDLALDTQQGLRAVTNAHEARVWNAYFQGNVVRAALETKAWLADERFSVRPAIAGYFFYGALLGDDEQALRILDLGLIVNPHNMHLTNSKLVSLVLTGKIKEARNLLEKVRQYRNNRDFRPFALAAEGLIAFNSGRPSDGRSYYEAAVESANAIKRLTRNGPQTIDRVISKR